MLASRAVRGVRARLGLTLFCAVGLAYVVSAFFRCDPGCPAEGSPTQQVHNAFGLLEYFGGAVALGLLCTRDTAGSEALGSRWTTVACTVLFAIGFGGLLAPELVESRGFFQRLADGAIFAWVALASTALWRSRSTRGAPRLG